MCNVATDFLHLTYNIENPIVKAFTDSPLPNLFAPAKF